MIRYGRGVSRDDLLNILYVCHGCRQLTVIPLFWSCNCIVNQPLALNKLACILPFGGAKWVCTFPANRRLQVWPCLDMLQHPDPWLCRPSCCCTSTTQPQLTPVIWSLLKLQEWYGSIESSATGWVGPGCCQWTGLSAPDEHCPLRSEAWQPVTGQFVASQSSYPRSQSCRFRPFQAEIPQVCVWSSRSEVKAPLARCLLSLFCKGRLDALHCTASTTAYDTEPVWSTFGSCAPTYCCDMDNGCDHSIPCSKILHPVPSFWNFYSAWSLKMLWGALYIPSHQCYVDWALRSFLYLQGNLTLHGAWIGAWSRSCFWVCRHMEVSFSII